jgi:hypothetical protein
MEEESEEDSPSILDAAEAMEPESEKQDAEEDAPAVEEPAAEAVEEVSETEESEEGESEAVDYSSMTVAELKELLKAAGKPVSGKKADLISRLEE